MSTIDVPRQRPKGNDARVRIEAGSPLSTGRTVTLTIEQSQAMSEVVLTPDTARHLAREIEAASSTPAAAERVIVEFTDGDYPRGPMRRVTDADLVVLLRSDGTYHVVKRR